MVWLVIRIIAAMLAGFSCLIALMIVWGMSLGSPVISYINRDSINPDIFLVDPDQGIRNNLSNSDFREWSYIWSPDGKQILYTVPGVGRGDTLFVMESSGGNMRRIESFQTPLAFGLVWSPDSRQVAYFSSHPSNVSDLYIIDIEADHTRNLTQTPSISEEFPIWSPDGEQLLYLSRGNIHLLDLTSGTSQIVLATKENEFNPVWSPNGEWIAFQRGEEASNSQVLNALFIVRPDGTDERRIAEASEQAAAWSPDGRIIAFTDPAQRIRFYERGISELRFLDTSQARRHNPVWSPDGTMLLFVENRRAQIYDLNAGIQRTISPEEVNMLAPVTWKP